MPMYEYLCTKCKSYTIVDVQGKFADPKTRKIDCPECGPDVDAERTLSTGTSFKLNFRNIALNQDGL